MVQYVPDKTGRFSRRPHYKPGELDRECENVINSFLRTRHGDVRFPVSTEDLTRLIERDTEDLDLYADLSEFGPDVEGVTEFTPGKKPVVKISEKLSSDERFMNRLRTTLTHEYGHVKFHGYLWDIEPPQKDFLKKDPNANKQICKRDAILNANQYDWMEWQAGYICGAILMPMTQVTRIAATYQEKHGVFGAVLHSSPHGLALIEETKAAFEVSADAARVRLTKLSVLSDVAPPLSLFST
jgi:IrrE N-terminal-like domain